MSHANTLPALSEAEFQKQVIDLAKLYGWRIMHARPARTAKGWRTPLQGHKGFPDLVLARVGYTIIAELKTDKAWLDPEQREWLIDLGIGDILKATQPVTSHVAQLLTQQKLLHESTLKLVTVWRPQDWQCLSEWLKNYGRTMIPVGVIERASQIARDVLNMR